MIANFRDKGAGRAKRLLLSVLSSPLPREGRTVPVTEGDDAKPERDATHNEGAPYYERGANMIIAIPATATSEPAMSHTVGRILSITHSHAIAIPT